MAGDELLHRQYLALRGDVERLGAELGIAPPAVAVEGGEAYRLPIRVEMAIHQARAFVAACPALSGATRVHILGLALMLEHSAVQVEQLLAAGGLELAGYFTEPIQDLPGHVVQVPEAMAESPGVFPLFRLVGQAQKAGGQ